MEQKNKDYLRQLCNFNANYMSFMTLIIIFMILLTASLLFWKFDTMQKQCTQVEASDGTK